MFSGDALGHLITLVSFPKTNLSFTSKLWTFPYSKSTTLLVRDALVTFGLSFGMALLVTSHVSITYGLFWRPPAWRALVAFLLPGIGPIWALRERMFVRAIASFLGAAIYAICAWDAFRHQ